MKTKTQKTAVGDLTVTITTDILSQNEEGDTMVEIASGVLCWVSGEEKVDFLNDINHIIHKYRI